MPSIYVYVSEETMERLTEAAKERGASPVDLAESAVAEAALDWWKARPASRGQEPSPALFTGENWDDPAAEHNRRRMDNH